MSQIALPLPASSSGPQRIIIGAVNAHVAEALADPSGWPFGTAVLTGPKRSGKSLFARWFAENGRGDIIDDAQDLPEDELFHRWNRAQEDGTSLLIIGGKPPWEIVLPDLKSRLSAALQLEIEHLEISDADDDMAHELLFSLAAERGLALGADAADYLIPRAARSQAELERLVLMIDRLSLERKVPPTQGIWRAALEAVLGSDEPRLL